MNGRDGRAFQIYLETIGCKDQRKMRTLLLYKAGIGFQEIYFRIPGIHVDADRSKYKNKCYDIAIELLDKHFIPKSNVSFERHVFRMIIQEPGEKFDKFLSKLREQAKNVILKMRWMKI